MKNKICVFLVAASVLAGSAVFGQVVTATANPQVAKYVASCDVGSSMRVVFKAPSDATYKYTPAQYCTGAPLTFLVAGMLCSTKYTILHKITSGSTGIVTYGPTRSFTTGRAPSNIVPFVIPKPPTAQSDSSMGILLLNVFLQGGAGVGTPSPVATDLAGNLLWYYVNPLDPTWPIFLTRVLPGGNMLLLMGANFSAMREIDLAWNIIRETNVATVNAQLAAMGKPPILNFNHEAIRLANGHTIVISNNQRLLTDVQGPGTVDVLGEVVLDLDEDFKVSWVWDAFDHLDPHRVAILGETCSTVRPQPPGAEVCPGAASDMLATTANDWLHANALSYDQNDGNLIVSLRHQDWLIKIDYANGTGTGNVVWRLGAGGDFQMLNTPNVSLPWFSHQHEAELEPTAGPRIISLFDNGNTRHAADPLANSRGQVLKIDETNMTADIVLSVDLTVYSDFAGSAQRLFNGNYHFLGGGITSPSGGYYNWSVEIAPTGLPSASGAFAFIFSSTRTAYRSFRLSSLYTP